MASAKLTFEVEGISHTLYFGMASVRLFEERAAIEYMLLVQSGIERPEMGDFDPIKSLANLLYSGLCNMADINDEQRPKFMDAYSLAESIWHNQELCENINRVWTESQPVKEMRDKLNSSTDHEEKKNPKRKSGKKLKPTQPVS